MTGHVVSLLTVHEAAAATAARILFLASGRKPLTVRQLRSLASAFGVCRGIPAAATGRLVGRYRGKWAYDADPNAIRVDPRCIELAREARRAAA